MRRFLAEIFAAVAVIIGTVYLCDARRIFAQEESNNHTGKRWHYLYKYGKQKNGGIDVLILGNSHSYTGLLPENLSSYLGKRCFILASQGNRITDSYYMLEEALTVTKPKLLVIETYTIRDYKQREMKGIDLSCQFQSFENRRNSWLKLKSTPALFSVDNAPYAWSQTIRNHSYIFENRELLKYNLEHPKAPVYKDKDYLGRFIRFTEGLSSATLAKYTTDGPAEDGRDLTVGADAARSVEKIKALCRKKGIKLMFLTIPMYHQHICNPEALHENLAPCIGDSPWLDLQEHIYDEFFTPDCFEDTYNKNQHQTAQGAAKSSILLAQFIKMNGLI
ncbi:MAG: hypothetical protein J5764_04450 [Bacteroidales bacterium]|nr:hypothetical protein [Bacteroidales bacterium]